MDHIFLYGPSGSGKSTVGRLLARDLHMSFVDTDELIEMEAGRSIAEIVDRQGMAVVRDLESMVLKQVAGKNACVIALGGGALLRTDNRELARSTGQVVLLTATLESLLTRLRSDSNQRPLLSGDLRSKLSAYLEERAEHYDSFPRMVQTDGKETEQISREIQNLLGRHHLSAMGDYDVIVGSISDMNGHLTEKAVLVTDENVAKHHPGKFNLERSIILPPGEEHKNLETVSRLWNSFLEHGLDRNSTVIAFGGGVIGDITGFAASTFMRGIDWIAIPTTLLSMADASLGGKTGIDLPQGKNLIGSFHPPKLVLADPSLLLTLSDQELRSGMAEVVKHGVIADPGLFEMCRQGMEWVKGNTEKVVKRAMAVKIHVIEEDPYEKGIRAALNLGHTVGHALELVSGFKLRHGEAISIGMVIEARYAERIGIAEQGLASEIAGTLSVLGLPIEIPGEMRHADIIRAMRMDKKKSAQTIRFALPARVGKVDLVEVSDLEDVLK